MMKTQSFIFLLVLFGISISLQAQWTQIGQDIDGEAASDSSGNSVSLSSDGQIVAIGAYNNSGNGSASGHVRIFMNIDGTWVQIGEDIDGEAEYDRSGRSVSLSADGSIVAIGAAANAGNGVASGHVRVYKRNSDNWIQIGTDIDGEAAHTQSGYSVSLSADGNLLAVGAPYNDDNSTNSGQVRIYQNIADNWIQLGSDIQGEFAHDNFGWSVSLSDEGTTLAVGAPFNDENGDDAGQVRVFRLIDGDWEQLGESINGEASEDRTGDSVSIDKNGDRIVIGAPSNDGLAYRAGHARVFTYINNAWEQIGEDMDGQASYDVFGTAVAINDSGNVVAIGASGADGNGTSSGHVRVFQLIDNTWVQVGADIDGEGPSNVSGKAIALSNNGSIVAIGAPGNSDNGLDAGHVRVYQNTYLDVSELLSEDMHLYPNPTSGLVYLKNQYPNQTIQIRLYDTLGKQYFVKTYQNSDDNIEMDISDLGAGLYFISIQTHLGTHTKCLIKK